MPDGPKKIDINDRTLVFPYYFSHRVPASVKVDFRSRLQKFIVAATPADSAASMEVLLHVVGP